MLMFVNTDKGVIMKGNMTTAGSTKKPNIFIDSNEALYDPYLEFDTTDEFSTLPWPEWNDADVNAETWSYQKVQPDKNKTKTDTTEEPTPSTVFEDSEILKLPSKIKDNIRSWKRPHEVFPDCTLTIYDPGNEYFELQLPNHAEPNDFFKSFIQQLPILQYYARKHGVPVEFETPTFVPTTHGEIWRPWHHIYALCKAGKGNTHKPLYSQYGKYILRLFYMGSWRKFVVDDRIPCDESGNCIFPVTQVRGELWPLLLIKGVLKIACIIRSNDLRLVDVPLLTLFTGWVDEKVVARNKTDEQVWRRLLVCLPHYEQPKEETDLKTASTTAKEMASKIGSSKMTFSKSPVNKTPISVDRVCFVVATLRDVMGEDQASTHVIGVSRVRDLPLIRVEKREPTKTWKRIRWIYWASKKDLWTDELKLPPYRRLECMTFTEQVINMLEPDPIQEATLFDMPADYDPMPSSEDAKLDPLHWFDFYKFLDVILRLNFMFKPSCFPSIFRVTSLKPDEVATGGKSAKPQLPLNIYYQTPELHMICNEPVILFCESTTGIFLCLSLWVYPKIPKSSIGYVDANHPEVMKVSNASLLIERFDWRTHLQGEILGALKTVGNSCTAVRLRPGRHVLKMWIDSDAPYLIDVCSNTQLYVSKGPKIRNLMSSESERIKIYVDRVSDAFISLTQKFGKPDLALGLRSFYDTIKPGNKIAIGYERKLDEFIETFLNCILLVLKNIIENTDEVRVMMCALRSLFLSPNIQCESLKGGPPLSIFISGKKTGKKAVRIVKERTLSEILSYPWSSEDIEKVIYIQRVFRGHRVRLLRIYQTPNRKEHKVYVDRLKKICDLVFAPQKRESEVGKLIRLITRTKHTLLDTFRFYEDFPNVIQVDEYSGKIPNVDPYSWVPITRFIIASHCDEPTPCSFYFSVNLEHFVILGVNNDTNKQLFRLVNSVSPHYFQCNVRGYTIFVFGWNEANTKTVNWRLEMVKMKYSQAVHLCNTLLGPTCHPYTMPNLEVSEVKNFYVPNHKSRICRCLIKIQKLSLLSLRLSTSYPDAQFVLTISLDKRFCEMNSETSDSGQVIVQVHSTNGAALVSSVFLEHVEHLWWGEASTDTSTLYILEAYVIDNSWPLTKQEWGVVEPIRVNGENWKESSISLPSKKGRSESRRRLSRVSKRGSNEQKPIENPFWVIQVLTDPTEASDSTEAMTVEEDKTYLESIKAMKMSWEEKDPGRRKRGRDLRSKFLFDIFQEEESDVEGAFEDQESFRNLVDRMSNFSYLTSDTSPTRYQKSPRVLPYMPTYDLLMDYSNRDNLSFELETLKQDSEISYSLVRNMVDEVEEDRKDFLEERAHFRRVMADHFLEEQKLSTKLMAKAYEDRLKAIERLAR